MVEAARTTASTTAIWMIVIVAVVVLASWLTAIMLADRYQARHSGPYHLPDNTEPGSGDAQIAEGVPDERAAAAPERQPVGVPRQHGGDGSVPEGDIPTRADLPAQRGGEADRAERRYAGPPPPDEDDAGVSRGPEG